MNDKRAIKSGFWFTVSNFVMRSIGFITTPIFTRLMTKGEFGEFSNFQTWSILLLYVTSLNLESTLIRATHELKDDLNSYVLSIISLSCLSTSVWWVFSLLFREQMAAVLSMNPTYINYMFAYLMFYPAVLIFQNLERFKYDYKYTIATSLAVSIGSSLLSVLFVITWEDKLLGRVWGYILPVIIIGALVIAYFMKSARGIKIKYWKYALPIALPFIPHLLSMYLLSNFDRVMIRQICGAEDLALYSLAYTAGMIMTILVSSVNSAFSPWLAEKLELNDRKATYKVSVPYITCCSIVGFLTVLVTPEILYILGGTPYMEAKYVMPPVAAGCLLQFTYSMYVNVEQYEKKTVGMAVASMIAAISNYFLNLLFIPRFGYIAAAYTTYAGYLILLLSHIYLVKKMGYSNVYNNKMIVLISIISSLLMFAATFVLDNFILRYALLFVLLSIIGIFVLKNKDKFLMLLKRK